MTRSFACFRGLATQRSSLASHSGRGIDDGNSIIAARRLSPCNDADTQASVPAPESRVTAGERSSAAVAVSIPSDPSPRGRPDPASTPAHAFASTDAATDCDEWMNPTGVSLSQAIATARIPRGHAPRHLVYFGCSQLPRPTAGRWHSGAPRRGACGDSDCATHPTAPTVGRQTTRCGVLSESTRTPICASVGV